MYLNFSKRLIILFSLVVLLVILLLQSCSIPLEKTPLEKTTDLDSQKVVPIPMKGIFKVTHKGGASYKIPLKIPISNGFSPKLSLQYNSQSGSGFIGKGWRLFGLPTIRLCRQTYAQEGIWSNISLDQGIEKYSKNRFCMSGKRLTVIKGNYGEDKSVYQTEILGKKRITAIGQCGNGPCGFKVSLLNGSVQTFGVEKKSIIQPGGKDVLVWGLNHWADKNNNEIKYTYTTSSDNILYPESITYGGNSFASKPDNRRIDFSYKNITPWPVEPKRIGLGGYQINRTKILAGIVTSVLGQTVMRYTIDHEINPITSAYRINELSLCGLKEGVESICHTPLQFKYDKTTYSKNVKLIPKKSINIGVAPKKWNSVNLVLMDKYGDGYNGLGIISQIDSQAIFTFARANSNGQFTLAKDRFSLGEFSPDKNPDHAYTFLSIDKNGDGLKDLLKIFKGGDGKTYAQAYLSVMHQAGFQLDPAKQFIAEKYVVSGDNKPIYAVRDMNGDGLSDLIEMRPDTTTRPKRYRMTVFYSDIKGGFPNQDNLNKQIDNKTFPHTTQSVDFIDNDGDSLADFFLLGSEDDFAGRGLQSKKFNVSATALYNRQNKLEAPEGSVQNLIQVGNNTDWETIPAYKWVDFNQDGLKDVVIFDYYQNNNAIGSVYINQGKLFSDMLVAPNKLGNTTKPFAASLQTENKDTLRRSTFVDINGDGLPDMVKYMAGSKEPMVGDKTYFEFYLHTDNSFKYQNRTAAFGAHTRNIVTDLKGDGVGDIISIRQEGGLLTLTPWINAQNKIHDAIVSIDNGIGKRININYVNFATDPLSLSKGALKYPNILSNNPRFVVKEYQNLNNVGKDYGYTISKKIDYKNPVYNQQTRQFYGYEHVIEYEHNRNLFVDNRYYVNFPLVGNLRSKTTGHIDTGDSIKTRTNELTSLPVYVNAKPVVYSVRKISTTNTVFRNDKSKKIAWQKQTDYHYDDISTINGLYANLSWSKYSVTGSQKNLYRCYTYHNDVTDNDIWLIGLKTGVLNTSDVNNCLSFKEASKYKFKTNDLKFKRNIYSSDGRYNLLSKQLYSDINSGFVGDTLIVDTQGRTTQRRSHSLFADAQGKYPENDRVSTIVYDYDQFGFIKQKTKKGGGVSLEAHYEHDSRFGVVTQVTKPNQETFGVKINDLGRVTSNFKKDSDGTIKTIRIQQFKKDGDKRYIETLSQNDWRNNNPNNWGFKRRFYDANGKIYRTEIELPNNIMVVKENKKYSNTGFTSQKNAPYLINEPKFGVSKLDYDDRWKVKQVTKNDGSVYKIIRNYIADEKHVSTYGPSPTEGVVLENKGLDVKEDNLPLIKRFSATSVPKEYTTLLSRIDTSTQTINSDILGRKVSETDFRNMKTDYDYDSTSRINCINSPDFSKQCQIYDGWNKLARKKLSNGVIFNYKYDGLKRIIEKVATDQNGNKETTSYQYDQERDGFYNKGLLTKEKKVGIAINYNYNINSLLQEKTFLINDISYTFEYEYSPLKKLTSIIYPDKSTLRYSYFNSGHLKDIIYLDSTSDSSSSKMISFNNYSAYGKPKTISFGNKLKLTRIFDNWGRTLSQQVVNDNNNIVSEINYQYNNAGYLIKENDNNGKNFNYKYDKFGRLIETNLNGKTIKYAYDANNNLLLIGENKFSIDPNSNRLHQVKTKDGISNISYDESGYPLSQTGSDNIQYHYSPETKLNKIQSNKAELEMFYLSNSKRYKKVNKSLCKRDEVTYYLDHGYEIEHKQQNVTNKKRVGTKGQTLMTITNAKNKEENSVIHISDRLRNKIMTIDFNTNKVIQSFDYYPYGNSNANLSIQKKPEFTGREIDNCSGLYNFGLRYYYPSIGRFLTPDPKQQYASSYSYGNGNPLGGIDRTGGIFGIDDLIEVLFASLIAEEVAEVAADTLALQTSLATTEAVVSGAEGAGLAVASSIAETIAEGAAAVTLDNAAGLIDSVAGSEQGASALSELDTTAATESEEPSVAGDEVDNERYNRFRKVARSIRDAVSRQRYWRNAMPEDMMEDTVFTSEKVSREDAFFADSGASRPNVFDRASLQQWAEESPINPLNRQLLSPAERALLGVNPAEADGIDAADNIEPAFFGDDGLDQAEGGGLDDIRMDDILPGRPQREGPPAYDEIFQQHQMLDIDSSEESNDDDNTFSTSWR